MTLLVLVGAVLAALAAAGCAFADGALLALDDDEPPSSPATRAVLARREPAHRALAFGRIVGQLLAGAGAAALVKVSGVPPTQVAPLVVLAGLALVVVTESAARSAGDALGLQAIDRVTPGIVAVERVLRPVVLFGAWCDALLLRLLPRRAPDEEEREATLEQFREVVEAEAEATPQEAVLLRGVFALGDTTVQEIMVPRVDIVGIERDTPWSEVLDRVRSARHARLVVFDGTLDEIVGILYAKDLLPALIDDDEPAAGWHGLIRPATYIPGTKSVDAQLRDFKATRRHLAIVADEYGGTAGLVTLEDALELIVGDIQDEHDGDEPEIVREGDDRFWLSARVNLDDVSALIGVDLTREDVQTVGGLVYETIGRVPRNGETFTLSGFRWVVERVVRRRVERVYLERLPVAVEWESDE